MGDDPATDGAAQRTAEQDQQLAHDADSSQSRDAVIQVQDVRVSFGSNEVLKGVSFQVRRGETLCILGGSGGGKSTLLKVMIGVLTPDSGHALIEGEHICCATPKARARIRRKFGVTFQGSALLNSLTVAENVALPLEYHTTLPMDMIETVVKIKLHQVDLLQAADKLPSQLSGGMKKRAAVARALAL
ncbi:MAG: ATP-binding cassette domain-containing protein, partial [Planctomycetota bacterium]